MLLEAIENLPATRLREASARGRRRVRGVLAVRPPVALRVLKRVHREELLAELDVRLHLRAGGGEKRVASVGFGKCAFGIGS